MGSGGSFPDAGLKRNANALPQVGRLEYSIVVCRDGSTLTQELRQLLVESTARIAGLPLVAIDVEFCSRQAGVTGRQIPALITIANQRTCICMYMPDFAFIVPKAFSDLICLDVHFKAFVNPRVDLMALNSLMSTSPLIPVNCVGIDVALAKKVQNPNERISLASIAVQLFGYQMAKDPDERCGRWQDYEFVKEHIRYATLDTVITFLAAAFVFSGGKQDRINDVVISDIKIVGTQITAAAAAANSISQTVSEKPVDTKFEEAGACIMVAPPPKHPGLPDTFNQPCVVRAERVQNKDTTKAAASRMMVTELFHRHGIIPNCDLSAKK